jgi:dienelactone hydrolase
VSLVLLSGTSFAQATRACAPATLEKGVVIPRVACAADAQQTYALYLPPNYSPDRTWPAIFAFDPAARGQVPVTLLKEAAEKYGYIVAGSNNSRNGPARPQVDAADAMMKDVSTRFPLDARRVYTAGFSGGARIATIVALLCGDCIAGVFAQGGGFPITVEPSRETRFPYFATVGDGDSNYSELFEVTQKMEDLKQPNRLRVFAGPHRWAPREVQLEAVEWMELRAMAEGRRPKDEAFIAQKFAAATERARKLEEEGDLFAAYGEYRDIARDFAGLTDVSGPAAKAAEWKDADAVRDGAKSIRKGIELQRALLAPFFADFTRLREQPGERAAIRLRLYRTIGDFQRGAAKTKDPAEQLVRKRVLTTSFSYSYESGDAALQDKDYELAALCFGLARHATPTSPWPDYQMARLHAIKGKKKEVFESLHEAAEKGLRSADLLRNTAEFAGLQSEPEFLKFLESLAAPR